MRHQRLDKNLNKELYNKILDSVDNLETETEIDILSGYEYPPCIENVTLNVLQNTISECEGGSCPKIVIAEAIKTTPESFDIIYENVPGFMATESIAIAFNGLRLYVPEGGIDYEQVYDLYGPGPFVIGVLLLSSEGEICRYDNITIYLIDNNEPPFLVNNFLSNSTCPYLVSADIGSVEISDTDATEEYRQVSVTILGTDSEYFSVTPIQVTIDRSLAQTFEFRLNTSIDPSKSVYSATARFSDGLNFLDVPLNITVHYPNISINTYKLIDKIPQGLNASDDNRIVLGHHVPEGHTTTNSVYCLNTCSVVDSFPYQIPFDTVTIKKTSQNPTFFTTIASNIDSYLANTTITGGSQISFTHAGDDCCGIQQSFETRSVSVQDPLVPFRTGIGPQIPFSGGSGNVELSYFERLGVGTNTDGNEVVIICPQGTGILTSNDDYFYLYTKGSSSYSGIKHPTETGLSEVAGNNHNYSQDHILCRYASNPSLVFIYDTSTSSWSSIQPFDPSSEIIRIIDVEDLNAHFILGSASGEYALFTNSQSLHLLADSGIPNGGILPANIAIIPNKVQSSCLFDTGQTRTFSWHIFALNHHYTGSSEYPLSLYAFGGQTSLAITSGELSITGNVSSGTTYLNSYLNYKTDIMPISDRLAISLSNTGNNTSELIIRHNTIDSKYSFLHTDDRRRLVKLVNNQILWCSHSNTGTSTVIDPFSLIEYNLFTPLTGSISVARSCYPEYRTLMLDSSGDRAYILNDLDRTHEQLSFTGNLPMGKYHDIYVFPEFTDPQSHNFYLMPTQIYETGFPSGHLVAISTTTVSAAGLEFSGDFTINETEISLETNQTTTGLIEIGSITVLDDEFYGNLNIGFDTNLGDGDIFHVIFSGQTGDIYVKSGIKLNYETKSSYTGYITGVDPYVGGAAFIDTFVLNVLDVDEKPTGIQVSPSTGYVNSVIDIVDNLEIANFIVSDPDTTGNNNIIEIFGQDKSIFTTTFDNTVQAGSLFIKGGTVFDIALQDTFNITLLVYQSGQNFSASTDFTLIVADEPPVSVVFSPNTIDLSEDLIVPSTGLKLADFILVDNDFNHRNYVELIGADSDYFDINYDLSTNSGDLTLLPTTLDFETKPRITGSIAAGNIEGYYSTTGFFIINILDVYEPTGIQFLPPSSVIEDTNLDTSLSSLKLADVRWTVSLDEPIEIYDIGYSGQGYLSALGQFSIENNLTLTPELHLRRYIELDPGVYNLYVSGRPLGYQDKSYGGEFSLIVLTGDRPPIITFDPIGLQVPEKTDTSVGAFKIADIYSYDEDLSNSQYYLTGADSQYFTLDINSLPTNSYGTQSLNVGDLYFNSGVVLDFATKNEYTGIVVGTDILDAKGSGIFVLTIADILECGLRINSTINNVICADGKTGRIFLDIKYTGDSTDVATCNSQSPLRVEWNDLPDDAIVSINGNKNVSNLPTGTYHGYIYGGNIPLSGISYTITSSSNLQLLQTIKNYNPCLSSGSIDVIWSGGVPPYRVSYGNYSAYIPSGSGNSVSLDIFTDIDNKPVVVQDGLGCRVSGATFSFSFDRPSFIYQSQSPPLIHDDALESFEFNVSYGPGPYEINIYNSVTGEKGELVQTFDRYDTSILSKVERIGSTSTDSSGNLFIVPNNPNPETYYYNMTNKIYPGQYIFEFVNANNCSFLSPRQTLFNITPLSATIETQHDLPVDKGYYLISQPILETLFIPYNMIVNNSDLLSYLSNITRKTNIKIQINDRFYIRQALHASINCDQHSILNIKYLGIKNTDWFYTLPFYQGFDLTDFDIDILNSSIYLILPNGSKIKVETELNNNINTIKLLKGSILTTNKNINGYSQKRKLGLFNFDFDIGDFVTMEVETLTSKLEQIYNKYIVGSISRIDFLNNSNISENLRSDQIESVQFDCNSSQKEILNVRNFVIALNNFEFLSNIYTKSLDYYEHDGSINIELAGAYSEQRYSVEYFAYNKKEKCVSKLLYNNRPLDLLNATDVPHGIYIIKIKDIYGNKLKIINNTSYDDHYISALDFILNELNVSAEDIQFDYGDILVNLLDLTVDTAYNYGLPGIEPETPEIIPGPAPLNIITTSTYEISPNKDYKNSLIIQSFPGKIPYVVSGPNGYNKTFYDRSVLIQMPPGVYNIKPDSKVLYEKYLYSKFESVSVTKDSKLFINLVFESYQDRIVLDEISCGTGNLG